MFQLSKSSPVEVFDNYIVCDGHSIQDLQGITVSKMQLYTGNPSEDDQVLFVDSCLKALGQVTPVEREAEYTTPSEPTLIQSALPEPVAEVVLPEIRLPGEDTLADREIEYPRTNLVIEVEGKKVFEENVSKEELRAIHSLRMKKYWADRKANQNK